MSTSTRGYLRDVARGGRAYVYVSIAEREIRRLAIDRLSTPDDPDAGALLARLNADTFARASRLRKDARSRMTITNPEDDAIVAFYTLAELRDLLYREWDHFSDIFGDREAFSQLFSQLESTRNAVAHSRIVAPDALERLEHSCSHLLERAMGQGASTVVRRFAPLDFVEQLFSERHLDVIGVYIDRGALQRDLPVDRLIEGAHSLDASGVSLNLVAQGFSARKLRTLIDGGLKARLLLLDPDGSAIRDREKEEGYGEEPVLRNLTRVNLDHLSRVANSVEADGLAVRTYNETIRISYTCIDRELSLVQPYLAGTRGVDSPTFAIRDTSASGGLFEFFSETFDDLWNRSK